MLGVSVPTVVNWTRAGRLDAHKTPGGHRRISQEAIQEFGREWDYPLPEALQIREVAPRGVLVIDPEPDFAELVIEMLSMDGGSVDAWAAADALSAGLYIGRHLPAVIVLDVGMGGIDPVAMARRLAADAETRGTRLLGLTSVVDPSLAQRVRDAGYADVRPKGGDLMSLVKMVRTLLNP
jgi:excisionase family DNA binding protein